MITSVYVIILNIIQFLIPASTTGFHNDFLFKDMK